MRETLIKLDDVIKELKEQLQFKDGKGHVDEKWLVMFDALVFELAETRRVINFATSYKGMDWEYVVESMKKAINK